MQSSVPLCSNAAVLAAAPSPSRLHASYHVEFEVRRRRTWPGCATRVGRRSCAPAARYSRARKKLVVAEVAMVDATVGDEGLVTGEGDEKKNVDVRALVMSLCNARTADDVEEVMKVVGEGVPLPVYCSMIRSFGLQERLDAAFAVVDYLKRRREAGSPDGPNLFIYNSLLGAVKQTRQSDRVDEVLKDMSMQGIAPNTVTFNTLMSVHLEEGLIPDALGVLADIERYGLSPTPVTHSTVLLVYKKAGDAMGALRYFSKLREDYVTNKGNYDDYWEIEFMKLEKFTVRVCCVAMRQSLVSEENPTNTVLNIMNALDEAQVLPSRTDYERLVWACTREMHYTIAKELYRRIRECDGEMSLSVCNHLIWLMGKAKKWWAALEIYEDLLDEGPKPNNMSYELIVSHFNVLLNAAKKRGIWRWGVRLLNKMQDKGLRPGSREWNSVLVACSKASETSAAVEIFRRMVEQGEKPTVISYGALLSALEKGKLYDEALCVWDHMRKVGVMPNLHAYTILVSIYVGKGNPGMVDAVLCEMQSSKIEPTVVTFNAIITGCAKKNLGASAFEWFNQMKLRNIQANEITFEMLIEALARDGKPRLAFEMYLKAHQEGLRLSSKSYDVVTEVCKSYSATFDLRALGPRPFEKKKTIVIRKNTVDFCHFADLPRRTKPFEMAEIYASHMQEK